MIPTQRMTDAWGSGWYGASRGSRSHRGIDFGAYPGMQVVSVCTGVLTKIGYPYSQDDGDKHGMKKTEARKFNAKKELRYVQVTNKDGLDFRYFYVAVDFALKIGDVVKMGDVLGIAQGLLDIYPGITDHIHFEVKDGQTYLDPNSFLSEDLA